MNNPFTLEGKTILVTGASSGIGKATAIACAKAGARVVLTARNEERLQETLAVMNEGVNVEGVKEEHLIVPAELCEQEEINRLVDAMPELDGAFLCAGVSDTTPVKYMTSEAIQRVLSINLEAPMLLTQRLLLKKKIRKGASLVYMSSMGAEQVTPGLGIYAASKNGLNAFMRAVAAEQASRKVRANAVMAGMVKTELIESLSQLTEEDIKRDEAKYPLGYGAPEDVANAVIYLLSDASKWMTGSVIKLDGGSSLSL